MKIYTDFIKIILPIVGVLRVTTGCDKLLDDYATPISRTVPENDLKDESHLMAYITNYYTTGNFSQESGRLDVHNSNPSGSSYWRDTKKDNAIGRNGQSIFLPEEVKGGVRGGAWRCGNIQ